MVVQSKMPVPVFLVPSRSLVRFSDSFADWATGTTPLPGHSRNGVGTAWTASDGPLPVRQEVASSSPVVLTRS